MTSLKRIQKTILRLSMSLDNQMNFQYKTIIILGFLGISGCSLFAPIEQPKDTPGPHFPENNTCSPYKGTMSCARGICTPDYGRTDCELRRR